MLNLESSEGQTALNITNSLNDKEAEHKAIPYEALKKFTPSVDYSWLDFLADTQNNLLKIHSDRLSALAVHNLRVLHKYNKRLFPLVYNRLASLLGLMLLPAKRFPAEVLNEILLLTNELFTCSYEYLDLVESYCDEFLWNVIQLAHSCKDGSSRTKALCDRVLLDLHKAPPSLYLIESLVDLLDVASNEYSICLSTLLIYLRNADLGVLLPRDRFGSETWSSIVNGLIASLSGKDYLRVCLTMAGNLGGNEVFIRELVGQLEPEVQFAHGIRVKVSDD